MIWHIKEDSKKIKKEMSVSNILAYNYIFHKSKVSLLNEIKKFLKVQFIQPELLVEMSQLFPIKIYKHSI